MSEGIVIIPARLGRARVDRSAQEQERRDRQQARVQRYRDRVRPLVEGAIEEEARGQVGSRAALYQALSEALEELDGGGSRWP